MTKQRRIAVAVPGLALVAFTLCGGACGNIFETNQGACRRMLNHFARCATEAGASNEAGTFFGVPVSQFCEDVSETSDRNFPAIADCMTSLSCAQLSGDEQPDFATQVKCLAAIQSR